MKSAWRNVIKAVSVAALSFASVDSIAQDTTSVPSKKELKVLLRTAKEPIEHRRIATRSGSTGPANHCRAYANGDANKANQAEFLAMLHEEMARAAEQRQP
jgi:hypothetical protein